MPNFRSVSLLVWQGGVTQINKQTNKAIEEICGKIHVTRPFFEASDRHGGLIEKTKKPVFR